MLYIVSDSDTDGSAPSPAAPCHVPTQGLLLLPLSEQGDLERLKHSCVQKQILRPLGNFTVEHEGPWGWQVLPGFTGSTSGLLRVIVLQAASKSSCGSSHKP